jgi:hypothetical protein
MQGFSIESMVEALAAHLSAPDFFTQLLNLTATCTNLHTGKLKEKSAGCARVVGPALKIGRHANAEEFLHSRITEN